MSYEALNTSFRKPLRVLFVSRTTLFSGPGGDTIQIVKTAQGLRSLGCEVEISVASNPSVDGFDVIHIFNVTRPQALISANRARKLGTPVVVSPIYVDYREADRNARTRVQRALFRLLPGSWAEYLKISARALLNREMNHGTSIVLRKGFRRAQRELLRSSALLLPNSESEMRRILCDFPEATTTRYSIVPNAVDHHLFDPERVVAAEEFRGCVLSVGRIERRKCQLELVRALRGTGLKLVVLGKPGPNQGAYCEQVKREADSNVTFIDHLNHEEVPRYYAACKVHALVSWMETTGLSSLEAGVMGANLVITDKGDTRDYFRDQAFYCRPDSITSIREAVLAAHRAPRSSALRNRILKYYTWEETARRTLAAYRDLITQNPKNVDRGTSRKVTLVKDGCTV